MRKLPLFLLLTVTACSPLYVPNTRNVPLFREQGEFQGTIYTSNGAELQLAYAVSDHVAVMGNASYLSRKQGDQDFTRKHFFAEGGIGFYNVKRNLRTELFTGYGIGSGTSFSQYGFFTQYFGQKDLVATAKYNRIFIQPSIGTNNRGFNIAFTPRISLVDFTEFSSSDNSTQSQVTIEPDESFHLFIEPALTGKFHLIGNLQGVFQLGLTLPTPNDVYFDYVPVQFSLGLQLNTGSLRTKVY